MSATDWTRQPAYAIAAAISAGTVTAAAVTEAHIAAIEAKNTTLGAYTDTTFARARAKAAEIDAARGRGESLPPLVGVPFAVKNLVDIAGIVTRAGAKINRENPPATADGACVTRLEAAGAVLLGALNMGEYAYDFTGLNAHDGPSCNPHDRARMTGGSSGGSGAAAAGGLAALTIGSDTNGSIRVPSSLCGLFGLKATYGAISRAGTFPFVASLDHIGPMARSVADLALAFDAIAGDDPADPVSVRGSGPVLPSLDQGSGDLRLARLGGYFAIGGQPECFAAVDQVAEALGITRSIEWPEVARARSAAFVITMIEGAALHAERIRSRPQDFDPEVRDRLMAGLMLPGAWAVKAQKFRRWYRDAVLRCFETVDVLIAPATPTVAPRRDEKTFVLGGVEMPVRANLGVFTQPVSFVGLPVVAVPLKGAGGLPIGVQVIAAPHKEAHALRVARVLEARGIATSSVAGG